MLNHMLVWLCVQGHAYDSMNSWLLLTQTHAVAGPKGLCSQLGECRYLQLIEECLPAVFDQKTLKQSESVKAAFNSFNSSVWGTCSGSCYVRQVSCYNNAGCYHQAMPARYHGDTQAGACRQLSVCHAI